MVSKNTTELSFHFKDGFFFIGHFLGCSKYLAVFQQSYQVGSDSFQLFFQYHRVFYNIQLCVRNSRLCNRKKMPLLKQILNFVNFIFQDPTSPIKVLISLVFTGNVVPLNQWPSTIQTSFFTKSDFKHQSCWLHLCYVYVRASSIFLLFTDVCSGLRRLPVMQVSIAEQLEVPRLGQYGSACRSNLLQMPKGYL